VFGWFRKRLAPGTAIEGGTEVEFLREQTGHTEARLVRAVAKELASRPGVKRAYLARVRYSSHPREEVALCLAGDGDESVFEPVQKIFWALFPVGQHLDIFYLTEDEERRLAEVCGPFHEAR
jgi:hypothetical protein